MAKVTTGREQYDGKDNFLPEYVEYVAEGKVAPVREDLEETKEKLNAHVDDKSNPHEVTKAQVGLGNVDNVKQASKAEFDTHAADKGNPHTVTKEQVGLGNVDNTADMDKPVSTAVQAALDKKTDKSTFNAHLADEENPHNVTKAQVGLGNVDNTADVDKPVSTAQANALEKKADKENGLGGFVGGRGAYANNGGGAIGDGATTDMGGAVGDTAIAENEGGAVGRKANTVDGGAVGSEAKSLYGGAVGDCSCCEDGGAIGADAITSNGFAGGKNAKTINGSNPIDAIQLGTGTNENPKTLQVYGYQLMDADGHVPKERLGETYELIEQAAETAETAANAANAATTTATQAAETAKESASAAIFARDLAKDAAENADAATAAANTAAEGIDEKIAGKADASALMEHTGNKSNPHAVTKAQVGLGNVDNTADMDKPVSTAVQAALETKQDICYCTCDTAAGTMNKVATVIAGTFELKAGAAVDVKFTNENTVQNATLNVNNTGAKSIKYGSANLYNRYAWMTGAVVRFVYDGTCWAMQGWTDRRTCRFVIGTTNFGTTKYDWADAQADYLCDGTKDQEEINAAIQALPDNGGEIVILDGTYVITAPIVLNKPNITLRGNAATKIYRGWGTASQSGVVEISSANCLIENITIDGYSEKYTQVPNINILIKTNADNTTIRNNIIVNSAGNNIKLQANNCTIDNNFFKSSASGDEINVGGSKNKIIGNSVSGENKNGTGIGVSYNSSDVLIVGNIVSGHGFGININGDHTSVIGNICNNNIYGVQTQKYATDCPDENIITGNTCSDNDTYGISASGSGNVVSSNICNRNGTCGIILTSGNSNICSNNSCIDNAKIAMRFISVKNSSITGNTCIYGTGASSDYSETQFNIKLDGSDSENNLISDNNIMGKNYVDNTKNTTNTFVNNKFE